MQPRGFEEAQAPYVPAAVDYVGQVRRFGPQGPAYEVLEVRANGDLAISVIESGERLDYPVKEFLADPIASTVP